MSRPRIAIIFDNSIRPETTGVYCPRPETMAEVQFFRPDQIDRVPRRGIDLYLNIDDGLRYRLPQELRPCAGGQSIRTWIWHGRSSADLPLIGCSQHSVTAPDRLRTAGL